MFRSISNASNDSPQPPMARQGSTTSRPQAARFSVYLSEPFSSQSLASTLVDYNDYVHATGTEVLVNHRHVEDVSKNKFQRGNVDTPVPKQWHVWLLRINVFLVSFSTHGYAISFGQQVVQRHDHWSKHPASALVMIGALQICMFYATVPAARIAQGQKWWEVLLLLSGVAAGSLICTAPKLNVLPAIVVLQGVCLGLSLAMMHNMVLLKVLQMKYDYITATSASMGGLFGGALTPLLVSVLGSSDVGAVFWTIGGSIMVLATSTAFTLDYLGKNMACSQLCLSLAKDNGHHGSPNLRQYLAIAGTTLEYLGLYIMPLLLPSLAYSSFELSTMHTALLLTTFWLSDLVIRLLVLRFKTTRSNALTWTILFSFCQSAVHVGWAFVTTRTHVFFVAAAAGLMFGGWSGMQTTAMVDCLGVGKMVKCQTWLNMIAACAILCGPPVAALLIHMRLSPHVGPAVFSAACFGMSGLLLCAARQGGSKGRNPGSSSEA